MPAAVRSSGNAGAHTEDQLLCKAIDTMTIAELDSLPQGAIQLDASGKILQYNAAEELLANRKREKVVGRNFFTDVAPCTDVKEFHGLFIRAVRDKKLLKTFRFHFPFRINPTYVSITLHYAKRSNTVWVVITRLH